MTEHSHFQFNPDNPEKNEYEFVISLETVYLNNETVYEFTYCGFSYKDYPLAKQIFNQSAIYSIFGNLDKKCNPEIKSIEYCLKKVKLSDNTRNKVISYPIDLCTGKCKL